MKKLIWNLDRNKISDQYLIYYWINQIINSSGGLHSITTVLVNFLNMVLIGTSWKSFPRKTMLILWNSLRECHLCDSLKALSTDRRWLISITNSCWSSYWSPWLAISSQEWLYHVFFYCSRCRSMWGNLVLLTDLIPFAGKVSLFFPFLESANSLGACNEQLKMQWSSWACLQWWALIGELGLPLLSANGLPYGGKGREEQTLILYAETQ